MTQKSIILDSRLTSLFWNEVACFEAFKVAYYKALNVVTDKLRDFGYEVSDYSEDWKKTFFENQGMKKLSFFAAGLPEDRSIFDLGDLKITDDHWREAFTAAHESMKGYRALKPMAANFFNKITQYKDAFESHAGENDACIDLAIEGPGRDGKDIEDIESEYLFADEEIAGNAFNYLAHTPSRFYIETATAKSLGLPQEEGQEANRLRNYSGVNSPNDALLITNSRRQHAIAHDAGLRCVFIDADSAEESLDRAANAVDVFLNGQKASVPAVA